MTIIIQTNKGQRIQLSGDSVQAAIKEAKPLMQKHEQIQSITTKKAPVN